MIQAVTATAAPLGLELLDYLMYYPGIAQDTGSQPLTTGIALPRYPTGANVQMMVVEQNSYVGGATFFVTYTNQDGTAGRVTPTVTCNTQISPGTIVTSATATAGCTGRFMPLQSGDSGVRAVDAIEFLTPDVGLVAVVLVKPLARGISIFEITAPTEIDFMIEYGFMPVVQPDAYLNLICKPTGTLASAPLQGDLTTVWSNT
jgi:hypothetical protein